jgi:hypothetical protein
MCKSYKGVGSYQPLAKGKGIITLLIWVIAESGHFDKEAISIRNNNNWSIITAGQFYKIFHYRINPATATNLIKVLFTGPT